MAAYYRALPSLGIDGRRYRNRARLLFPARFNRQHYFGPDGHLGLSDLPFWVGRALPGISTRCPSSPACFWSHGFVFLSGHAFERDAAPPLTFVLAVFMGLHLIWANAVGSDCDQRGHMFGYWSGTICSRQPFKDADGRPLFRPWQEMRCVFGGTDPGRFCPTYMIFCESFTPHRCQPREDQTFDRRDVYLITQNALADLRRTWNHIRAHYNRSAQIDPPFFSELVRTDAERQGV